MNRTIFIPQRLLAPVLLVVALSLVACAATPAAEEPDTGQSIQQFSGNVGKAVAPPLTETLVDEQGAVSVAVTPLNVRQGAATLDFEVAMNTHSVELDMDLATLATLVTDTGAQVTADVWDAPRGGHHVSGVLSFPVTAEEGDLLTDVLSLTLLLREVGTTERTFTWNLD